MKGAARGERREYERAAQTARWIGTLVQSDPRKQPTIERMLGKQPQKRSMNGSEIDQAMRAWAKRMS